MFSFLRFDDVDNLGANVLKAYFGLSRNSFDHGAVHNCFAVIILTEVMRIHPVGSKKSYPMKISNTL